MTVSITTIAGTSPPLQMKSPIEISRGFMNEPGKASAFAVGDIHSIEYGDDTFFIRVTGGDVEQQKTLRFDPDKKAVQVADRAQGQR